MEKEATPLTSQELTSRLCGLDPFRFDPMRDAGSLCAAVFFFDCLGILLLAGLYSPLT